MPQPIRIKIGDVSLEAELNETLTAQRVAQALPLDAAIDRWGDEIYFRVPVKGDMSEAERSEAEVGELAFWPPGNTFCIFWGPTPASEDQEPRAASNIIPLGRIRSDLAPLKNTREGQEIILELA
jgi:hypothetical protein